ncbi:MAG: peptidylprolyl isomerase [Terracidiphilus sp.]
MKISLPLFLLFLLPLGFVSAQVASHAAGGLQPPPAPAPGDKPVARVNGVVLSEADLEREEFAIFPYARQHGGALPKDLEPEIRGGALKMIIFEELVYQEALRRKMTIPAARMERAEAEFRKQFATPDEFNALLASDFHGSERLLLEKIRRSLLIEALLRTEVDARSVVSAAELRAYYDHNPARFEHPETYTFQTISVLPPEHATPKQLLEGRIRADGDLTQAKATKSSIQFGLLAEKLSDDDYRVVMGQHRPVAVNQLAPPVLAALKAMKPGDISPVLQLGQAYTIVRLQVHAATGKTPFIQVRKDLEKELHDRKKNELRSALDHKLRASATVETM